MTTRKPTKSTDVPDDDESTQEPSPAPAPEEAPVPSTPEPGKTTPADQPVESPSEQAERLARPVDPNVYPDPDNVTRHP